jgi:hypothetical protein
MSFQFQGHGSPLDNEGLLATLDTLGIEAARLWAVLSVETSCVGYFSNRKPSILYEQHVFHRLTNGVYDKETIRTSATPNPETMANQANTSMKDWKLRWRSMRTPR